MNVNVNDNDKDNENENENENEYENYDDYKIKQLSNYFKMIGETKSFEEQINLFKKIDYLNGYWNMRYYDDDKELNLKIF